MVKHSSMKVVADPSVTGIIDIGSILPIIETRAFQLLDERRQLGMTYLVFRDARHSRFIHSLGSYCATRKLADRWILEGSITRDEGAALSTFALLHDVGHAPFSHTSEDFCPKDHHETTIDLITDELKGAIEACDVDADIVAQMARREHPLFRAVCDKNIGTEKLDYLERDGKCTIGSRPPGIEYLRNYVFCIDGRIAVDKKVVDHTLDTMNFYMQMYKGVYLRKALVIAQRMFHKALYHLLESGGLSSTKLPGLTDPELLGIMSVSQDQTVQDMYGRIRERRLFKEAIVIRPQAFYAETRIGHKAITVVGVEPEEMLRISRVATLQKNNHAGLGNLETLIAQAVAVPVDKVLVVPVFYPERFEAQDVNILSGNGNLYSLKSWRPDYFKAMEETARSYAALRICVSEEYRDILSAPQAVSMVREIINSFL